MHAERSLQLLALQQDQAAKITVDGISRSEPGVLRRRRHRLNFNAHGGQEVSKLCGMLSHVALKALDAGAIQLLELLSHRRDSVFRGHRRSRCSGNVPGFLARRLAGR